VAASFKGVGAFQEAEPAAKSNSGFRTFPAWFPVLCLDRIFYRQCTLSQAYVFARAGRLGRSDHLPIIADFHLTANSD
jgi:endonuclease/exonuclease/phosphatase family metal-dependent hydrolase